MFDTIVNLRLLKNRMCGYHSLADPFRVVYIDPNDVTKYTLDFNTYSIYGDIQGGDWDTKSKSFDKLAKYTAIKKRFKHGMTWEETGVYDELLSMIEDEGSIDKCTTRDDLKRRYEEIDELYEDISKNGYKEASELPDNKRKGKGYINNICVNIGRNGELIFQGDGFHRLSIAKVLQLNEIPIQIALRHKKWQEYRQRISNSENQRFQTQWRNHPDLKDVV
ncbi:hypothetical protein [Natronoglomus mannanivorans]|uniref:ParB-like nuclease domain-containing protein n=1 Tax=Natronoglomus mannanivorans TaxID=2979990 RepID=A0AAP3E3D5_9EURY|nr:hypothetical protein [Halobacteria archaeon AArc-xg1-1]